MQMTSRTIVINFAEHQPRWHKAESKSPKPKKAKVGERQCRVFEFEIFAIANPVLQVPKLMMEINSRERRTRTRTMLTARTSRSQKFRFCTQEEKPGKTGWKIQRGRPQHFWG
ncbi:GD12863 [Drosophila simulans]|uniref:GD12863 n=1 Tax=Drosophila simulans TaxID=7240 RepID=B4QP62_DROSI|nr:GD12863 [Drosophila simulans]